MSETNRLHIEEAWKHILNIINKCGNYDKKDDSEIKEYLGIHLRINNPVKSLLGYHISPETFVDMAKKGVFDIDGYPVKQNGLSEYINSINDWDQIDIHPFDSEKKAENPFVYTYPERIQKIWVSGLNGQLKSVNQFNVICNRLKNNIGSNRAIAVIYQAGMDSEAEDIPCLQLIQAIVRKNKLILTVFFRSNDIYGAFPSNMLFLSHIGLLIEQNLNTFFGYKKIEFDYIDYHVSSAHYYKTDEDAVKNILEVK